MQLGCNYDFAGMPTDLNSNGGELEISTNFQPNTAYLWHHWKWKYTIFSNFGFVIYLIIFYILF